VIDHLALVAAGDHLFVKALPRVHAAGIQTPVKRPLGHAAKAAGLHIDEHAGRRPGCGQLGDVLPALGVAGVDPRTIDEPRVAVKNLILQPGHTAQNGGHRVVEDHKLHSRRPLGRQCGGDFLSQQHSLRAGDLHLLGDGHHPSVPVGQDLGGVGEAQAHPAALPRQRQEDV